MQVSRTHMKKREMAFVLKFVAAERSERGDLKEAESRVNRAETLITDTILKSDFNLECLANRLEKVDVLLKLHKHASADKLAEICLVAQSAVELAKKLYGEKSLIYFKTMLKYATTLSKCEDRREEGIKLFMGSLNLVKELKQALSDSDLPFNMLLFMLMESPLLENGSNDLDLRPISEMIEREANAKYGHNQAKKQALILIHRASCFDGTDMEAFLRDLGL